MKKSLAFLTLGFLTSALMASLDPDIPPPKVPVREPTPIQGFPINDATLRGQIFDLIDDIWLNIETEEGFLFGVKDIAQKGGVTPERMTKMLESIVREGLRELEKTEKGTAEYTAARTKVIEPVQMLSVFPGPNTLALLKECALAEKGGRTSAMKSYISIAGAVESIPFLAEIIVGEAFANKVQGKRDLNPYRASIVDTLHSAAKKLEAENKKDDALQVYIFLKAMAWTETEPNTAYKLDQILCATLPDYSTSFEREQNIEQFADLQMNTDYFKNIKAELSKVPANRRRDYEKQPLRQVKESEMRTILLRMPPR